MVLFDIDRGGWAGTYINYFLLLNAFFYTFRLVSYLPTSSSISFVINSYLLIRIVIRYIYIFIRNSRYRFCTMDIDFTVPRAHVCNVFAQLSITHRLCLHNQRWLRRLLVRRHIKCISKTTLRFLHTLSHFSHNLVHTK